MGCFRGGIVTVVFPGKGTVFAALGPQNTTANMIRRLAGSSLEASWSGTDAFQV